LASLVYHGEEEVGSEKREEVGSAKREEEAERMEWKGEGEDEKKERWRRQRESG
jgi:hypothetical protein